MALDKVVAPLLRQPLFAGLKPQQLTEIARHAERVKFRDGDVITQAGSPADGAYLIVSGEAERQPQSGSFDLAERVEEGSLIGELGMLMEHTYGVTVVARGRVHCLKIAREAMLEQMREDEALARHFRLLIEGRLTQAAAELRRIIDVLNGLCAPQTAGELPANEPEPPAPALIEAASETPATNGDAGGTFTAIFPPPAATGTDG
jgi:signal-transduction protein with cAMP-binding, CBS, and nucleotidyltransferase domain